MLIAFGIALGSIILAGVLFHMYDGLKDSLTNARIGSVYNFDYEQPKSGENKRFMAKVVAMKVMDGNDIRKLNNRSKYRMYDSEFVRTPHLVTAVTPNGQVRNFYAERATNVRRPLFGKLLFQMGIASKI